MQREMQAVLAMRDVQKQLESVGMDIEPSQSPHFQKLIQSDVLKGKNVIQEAKIKPQ
jgi:hypothetical protein